MSKKKKLIEKMDKMWKGNSQGKNGHKILRKKCSTLSIVIYNDVIICYTDLISKIGKNDQLQAPPTFEISN